MPNFSYIALDPTGKETQGFVEADSQSLAISLIKDKGLFPTNVQESSAPAAKAKRAKRKAVKSAKGAGGASSAMNMEIKMPTGFYRVKPKQLMVTTRQLATLINAGMPLLRCLQVLRKQEKNPAMIKTLDELGESIQSGSTFGDAVSQHPKVFNKLYVNMVKAGELGGVLDVVLIRLAEFMEKAQKIKSKVISAMVYPVLVLTMAMIILTFLMIFVVPKFEEVFEDLLEGGKLPPLTQFVMDASHLMGENLIGMILLIVVLIIGLKLFIMTDVGRKVVDQIKLSMPLFGILIKKTAISRFSRTLGTLMSSGVPVLQALTIVKDTAGNEVIANAVSLVHDSVKEGENIAPPVESTGVFPPMVVSMIEVGEETGDLPDMLIRIADTYEEEVDDVIAGLTSIIEPILIVFLALIVGTIVIALFMPLISVIGKLSS